MLNNDDIETLREYLNFAQRDRNQAVTAYYALNRVFAELTRLRERNAELEKERDAAQGTADDIYAKLISDRARIASLEAELDLANKQIAETGRAWTSDRTSLDAAAAVYDDAQWDAAIESAAQMLDNHWDHERGDNIRSLKRLK